MGRQGLRAASPSLIVSLFGTFQGDLPLFQCPFLAVPAAACPSEQVAEPKGPCQSPQDGDVRAEEATGHTAEKAKGNLALSPALQSAGFWQQECKLAPSPEPPVSGGLFGCHPSTRSWAHLYQPGQESSERSLSFRIPLPLQRGSQATLPHPRSHPTYLAGGEGNECLISANQAAVLVRCDSRGHGQRTGRDVCPVLTTSSSASGWGNQRQPAGDASWGSRHSQPGSPSEPGELRALPLLTPVPAQDRSPAREQTQGRRHAQLPGPWKGPGLAWADEDWSPHQCFSVQGTNCCYCFRRENTSP